MQMAELMASRSKDPDTQIGAIIVNNENRLLGTGYNGPPKTINDNRINWERPFKYPFIVHAEENAIYHAIENVGLQRLKHSTLFTSGRVCSKCMLRIARVEISCVIIGGIQPAIVDLEDQLITAQISEWSGIAIIELSK
jgi:dCMP deaminase